MQQQSSFQSPFVGHYKTHRPAPFSLHLVSFCPVVSFLVSQLTGGLPRHLALGKHKVGWSSTHKPEQPHELAASSSTQSQKATCLRRHSISPCQMAADDKRKPGDHALCSACSLLVSFLPIAHSGYPASVALSLFRTPSRTPLRIEFTHPCLHAVTETSSRQGRSVYLAKCDMIALPLLLPFSFPTIRV